MSLANIVILSALGYGLYKYVYGELVKPLLPPVALPIPQDSTLGLAPINNIQIDTAWAQEQNDDMRNGRLRGPDGRIGGAQFY